MILQAQQDVVQQVGYGPIAIWFALALLFAFWGMKRGQDLGMPGWLGFVTILVVGSSCSLLGALLAIYLLLPVVATIYKKSSGSASRPSYGAYGPPRNSAPGVMGGMPEMTPGPQTPDTQGFVRCNACGDRVRANRKNCMSCGAPLSLG